MTPAETARRLCFLRGGNWSRELEAFLENGYVVSTPAVFAMGRFCAPEDHLPDPWEKWPEGNSFFAWSIVGDLREVLKHLPGQPEMVGHYREGRGWKKNHWVPLRLLLTRTR